MKEGGECKEGQERRESTGRGRVDGCVGDTEISCEQHAWEEDEELVEEYTRHHLVVRRGFGKGVILFERP